MPKSTSNSLKKSSLGDSNSTVSLLKWSYLLLIPLALGITGLLVTKFLPSPPTNFAECLEVKGSLTQESYPAVCITPDGLTFTEETPAPVASDLPVIPTVNPSPEPTTPESVPSPLPTTTSECLPAGCSGQLCVPAAEAGDTMTTCEFKPEYACVNFSTCEKQPDGKCGWTKTDAYLECQEQY